MTELPFAERRRPTFQEVLEAVPDRPVYLQMFYSHVLVTPTGLMGLGLNGDAPPPGLTAGKGQTGRPTGCWTGSITTISPVFYHLPKASAADNLVWLQRFFAEMNRLGVTGVLDAGGFDLAAPQYEPLFQPWRQGN